MVVYPASITSRIKAMIVDVFMIFIPILYFTTYVILDGKEDFQSNQFAIFTCTFLFGLITSMFLSIKSQTPGCKAYEIYLIDLKTKKKPKFIKCFLRYIYFLISATSFVGIILAFFRKDKKNLHDLISLTQFVRKK